jgi:superfamily II DNA/RNA helicase
VIQLGVCSSKEQYIHRLGRTARAGKEGAGLSILTEFEKPWLETRVSLLPYQKLMISDSGLANKRSKENSRK